MESDKKLISVIIPAYNEEALLAENVAKICDYLGSQEAKFNWEILIVNDGSTDSSGDIANKLSAGNENIIAIHHPVNFGLGQALKFGFANTRGDLVVTLDVDLSYDVRHIGELVDKAIESRAKIVLASPYMSGGTIKNVPVVRRVLSILGNRFLKIFVKGNFSTLTSMVRIYDGEFIRAVDLRAMGMDIMPETLYKGMILRAKIEEIPARLDWGPQLEFGAARTSSMRLVRHVFSTILSGFVFRPFLFFVVPGIIIGLFSIYVNFWMVIHFYEELAALRATGVQYSVTDAFANAYRLYPHTFVTGLLSAMLAIQLVGLGLMALQSKRNFEELFHLGSGQLKTLKKLNNQ